MSLSLCALCLADCDGRSSDGGRDTLADDIHGTDASADTPGGDATPTPRPVLYQEFLPELVQGMYWDVAYRFTGFTFDERSGFRITLGAPVALDGHQAFPITQQILWQTPGDEPVTIAATHLAVDETRLWARFPDGWAIVFDSHGLWTGAEIFWSGQADALVREVAPETMESTFGTDTTTLGAFSYVDTSSCEYYPELGQTLCDNGNDYQISNATGKAFFKAGVGFYGHVQHNCVDGGCGNWEYAVVAHGVGASTCGASSVLPEDACSAATRTCIENCIAEGYTNGCYDSCAFNDPDPACNLCFELRYASCGASESAQREYRCCAERVANGLDGCPPLDYHDSSPPGCFSLATVAPCVDGLSACAGEFPKWCDDRRDAAGQCVEVDTACNTLVDCPSLGVVGCGSPTSAPDCAAQVCVVVVDAEGSDATCSDGVDNDGNGYTDCRDFSCSANPLVDVCGATEVTDGTCSDGVDNDGNGYADCRDFNCRISPSTTVCGDESTPTTCGNGADEDGDGKTDCADPSCSASAFVDCPGN